MGIFAQTTEVTVATVDAGFAVGYLLFVLALVVISIVAMWRVFEKAEREGWKAIIPIYNTWVLFKIAGREGWWIIFLFIPFVNIIASVILAVDLAKAFGKSTAFGIFALWMFSLIGFLILGFGDAEYQLDKPT